MSDIEVFAPRVEAVTVNGQTVTFGPLTFKDFAPAQIALRPLVAALSDAKGGANRIITDLGDQLVTFLSLASGHPKEWFQDQTADVLLDCFGVAVAVNVDFSRRRITPAFDRLAVKIAGAGAQPSPSLDGLDTPSQSSET